MKGIGLLVLGVLVGFCLYMTISNHIAIKRMERGHSQDIRILLKAIELNKE